MHLPTELRDVLSLQHVSCPAPIPMVSNGVLIEKNMVEVDVARSASAEDERTHGVERRTTLKCLNECVPVPAAAVCPHRLSMEG